MNKTFDLLDGQNSAFLAEILTIATNADQGEGGVKPNEDNWWGEEGLEKFHQRDFMDTKNVDREDT